MANMNEWNRPLSQQELQQVLETICDTDKGISDAE